MNCAWQIHLTLFLQEVAFTKLNSKLLDHDIEVIYTDNLLENIIVYVHDVHVVPIQLT